jgi:hypothetical protein
MTANLGTILTDTCSVLGDDAVGAFQGEVFR